MTMEQLLSYQPENLGARINTAEVYSRLDMPSEAQRHLHYILKVDPKHAAARQLQDRLIASRR